jgi:hypothetical protein
MHKLPLTRAIEKLDFEWIFGFCISIELLYLVNTRKLYS